MRAPLLTVLAAAALLGAATSAFAQPPRTDVIWARSTAGAPITLDGHLTEPAWAKAESLIVRWGVNNGSPGSGYKPEGGFLPSDPSFATIKFLTVGDNLYLGAVMRDSSVGGSADFNRFDGLLMMIMNHTVLDRPTPVMEHLYSWWYPTDATPMAINKLPNFAGYWSAGPGNPRDSASVANWDAVTTVQGISNSDTLVDQGYTIEMRFKVSADGYNITQAAGDVVEWSGSLYDCDWYWPINVYRFASNRTWWQNPWGNVSWYHEGHIYCRPDVTINSGPVPFVQPDVRIPNAGGWASPTIDGKLNDPVWSLAPKFDIRYGDDALRLTYPNTGKYRSGQFQPTVNGGQAYVADPGDATVRYFFKDDSLFLGFDVRDQVVQYHANFDRWDGFIVTVTEKTAQGPDKQLLTRRLTFQVGPTGQALAQDYLPFLRDTLHGAAVALKLKGGTTLDTTGAVPDSGYTAELKIDLTKLGFPADLGDHVLFLGVDLMDGDSFVPYTDSYGTRTWWFRQYEGENGPAWCYLDPGLFVTAVSGPPGDMPPRIALLGNGPNPFQGRTTIRYSLAARSDVALEVFDLQGRRVARQVIGTQGAGPQHAVFERDKMSSGLYLYRLVVDPEGGKRTTLSGKMMVIE
jgi:hypothetical protein